MIFLNLFKDSLRVTREEESGIDTLSMPSIDMAMIKIYSNPRIFNRCIYIYIYMEIEKNFTIRINIY